MREIPKSKRYAIGWYNEGIALMNIREYEEAISFFDLALSIVPDHPDFLIGKGDVLYAIGKPMDALEMFRRAINAEPHNRKAWFKAGLCLLKAGKNEDALEIFQYLLKLDSHDGEVWFANGLALMQMGQREEAREAFRNARRLKPDQPALWHSLAKTEEDPREALRLLERGHRLDPSNLDILLAMAERHLALGERDEALQWCRKAAEHHGDHPKVRELLKLCMLQ